ncbi:MAG TPA: hypothetical protein VF058_06705 [Actinomycetota bacterium]
MRLTWRDGIATLFAGAVGIVYGLWLTETAMSGMSTRVLGGIVLGLGMLGCAANQAALADVFGVGGKRRAPMAYVVFMSAAGGVALVAGAIAVVAGSKTLLTTLVIATLTLWLITTVRHAVTPPTHPAEAPAGRPMAKVA